MSLRVHAVVMHDGQGPPKLPAGVQLVPVRELAAIAEEGEYSAREVETAEVARHVDIIGALFEQDAVLPTPVGTVFRSVDVLQKWMELHYVALSDALAWVEDRVGARVHVTSAEARTHDRDAASDLAGVAAEIARSLRRHAVASVPLRNDELTGIVLSAAFLIEEGLWQEFADALEDERERHGHVKIELSGPWPPYDFVRLQFGA